MLTPCHYATLISSPLFDVSFAIDFFLITIYFDIIIVYMPLLPPRRAA